MLRDQPQLKHHHHQQQMPQQQKHPNQQHMQHQLLLQQHQLEMKLQQRQQNQHQPLNFPQRHSNPIQQNLMQESKLINSGGSGLSQGKSWCLFFFFFFFFVVFLIWSCVLGESRNLIFTYVDSITLPFITQSLLFSTRPGVTATVLPPNDDGPKSLHCILHKDVRSMRYKMGLYIFVKRKIITKDISLVVAIKLTFQIKIRDQV